MQSITLGTRGSPLALWQTTQVTSLLKKAFPELIVERKVIKTKGDKILDIPLAEIGDKGLFTKELEVALEMGEIDCAVHSLKDLPTELPKGMILGAVFERKFVHDVLVSRKGGGLDSLSKGAVIGTGSLRRLTQLKKLRPDLVYKDLRGNIQTRLAKLERGDYDAIIMAEAALKRLDLDEKISMVFSPDQMLPAVGQGVIAIELRTDSPDVQDVFKQIQSDQTWIEITAERALLKGLGGGCEQPIGGYAYLDQNILKLSGYLASTDGEQFMLEQIEGEPGQAMQLGVELSSRMLALGGADILAH